MNSTLALGIAAILFALTLNTQTDPFPDVARRMPVLLIWIVVGLALLMIMEELLTRRRAARAVPAEDVAKATQRPEAGDSVNPAIPINLTNPVNWAVLASFGAAIVAYVAFIPLTGYLLATPVFVAGSLLVSRTLPAFKAVLIGLAATLFVWAIFIWALNLPVPLLPSLG